MYLFTVVVGTHGRASSYRAGTHRQFPYRARTHRRASLRWKTITRVILNPNKFDRISNTTPRHVFPRNVYLVLFIVDISQKKCYQVNSTVVRRPVEQGHAMACPYFRSEPVISNKKLFFKLQETAFNGLQRDRSALSSASGRNGTDFQRAFAAERPLAGVWGWRPRV